MGKINKTGILIVGGGILLTVIIAVILLTATATKKAIVLNSAASAGTTITEGMLKEIDVPKDTPGDFITSKKALVDERLAVRVEEGQLIYPSNLTKSVEFKRSENSEFVNCTIKLDDDQAMGGLLAAGDVVDIGVIPKGNKVSTLAGALPEFNIAEGQLSYIIANVTLMDTTTALSNEKGSAMSEAASASQDSTSSKNASYYMLSLSYRDYKILRAAEENGVIYMNMSPRNNEEYAPLLEKMKEAISGGLLDAAPDPIKAENGKDNNSNNDANKEDNNKNENKRDNDNKNED